MWRDIPIVASLEVCQFFNCLILTGTLFLRTIHTLASSSLSMLSVFSTSSETTRRVERH